MGDCCGFESAFLNHVLGASAGKADALIRIGELTRNPIAPSWAKNGSSTLHRGGKGWLEFDSTTSVSIRGVSSVRQRTVFQTKVCSASGFLRVELVQEEARDNEIIIEPQFWFDMFLASTASLSQFQFQVDETSAAPLEESARLWCIAS